MKLKREGGVWVLYNRLLPVGDYHGMNLLGIILAQQRWGRMLPYELKHERIHFVQQLETGFLLFFLWYAVEFLVRLCLSRGRWMEAYRSISFEREAFAYERDFQYLRHRHPFAWVKYL